MALSPAAWGMITGVGGASISGAGSLGGALFGNYQSRKAASTSKKITQQTNLLNYALQQETNALNAKLVADQIRFQERMSRNQYQRAVKDLRKANLNPILAALNGGNAAPAGASVKLDAPKMQASNAAEYVMRGAESLQSGINTAFSALGRGISDASSGAKTMAEAVKIMEDTKLSKSQTAYLDSLKDKTLQEMGLVSAQTKEKIANSDYLTTLKGQVEVNKAKLQADTEKLRADTNLSKSQREKIHSDIKVNEAQTQKLLAEAKHYLDAKRFGNAAQTIVNNAQSFGRGTLDFFNAAGNMVKEQYKYSRDHGINKDFEERYNQIREKQKNHKSKHR